MPTNPADEKVAHFPVTPCIAIRSHDGHMTHCTSAASGCGPCTYLCSPLALCCTSPSQLGTCRPELRTMGGVCSESEGMGGAIQL